MNAKERLNVILRNHATSFPDKVSESILKEFVPIDEMDRAVSATEEFYEKNYVSKVVYDKDKKLMDQLGYVPKKDYDDLKEEHDRVQEANKNLHDLIWKKK